MPNEITIHKASKGPLTFKRIHKPVVGREMDLLVATSVLRLEIHEERWGKEKQHYRYSVGYPDYYDNAGEMILDNYLLPYSEDIKAAWEVLTANHEHMYVRTVLSGGNHLWECHLSKPKKKFARDAIGVGSFPAEAICLAALGSVGYLWD